MLLPPALALRVVPQIRPGSDWYEAFGVKEDDLNYIKSEDRVHIW